jgi:glucose/arabinose dehydrogenase
MHHSLERPAASRGTRASTGCRIRASTAAVALASALAIAQFGGRSHNVGAQGSGPALRDANLTVTPLVTGLATPISISFLGTNDLLVLEKNTGQVKRVVNGVVQSAVLDLAVNTASERGLLGIALHPGFPSNPSVYLYWTESTTGADTAVIADTSLLGNRVDRFVWNGSSLIFAQNLLTLRALQPAFAAEPTPAAGRGNHNGGVITFGPDGKLYVFVGDVGRRGQAQNLPNGPFGPGMPDDSFGGPQPDNAHLTGVILRLNDDGTTPADNPFFAVGAALGGEIGANVQKLFSYGHRNSIGMAFDPDPRGPRSLWLEENGDDSFTELNLVEPGMNGGWVQIMGPVERIGQYKAIETSPAFFGLQQSRWSPTNIADTPQQALSALFMLPGAHYSDPEFSWRFEVAPAGLGFLNSRALGPQYEGDLFVGGATAGLQGGHLFQFNLTEDRRRIAVDDPRLEDRVADNLARNDLTESETLLFGTNFGIVSDIKTGPNGNLLVVSLTLGAIYEIARRG